MNMHIGLWNDGYNALVVGTGQAVAAVIDALRISGARTFQLGHDQLENEQVVSAKFDEVESRLEGKITALVFADTVAVAAGSDALSLEDWHHVTAVNLDARFFCAAELARRCIADRRQGVMLHLVSKAAEQAAVGFSAGAAAAGGVLNLNMSLAVEWARDNIRSNVIATRLLDHSCSKDQPQLDSLGALAAYYCSDYASYITGSCVGIDES